MSYVEWMRNDLKWLNERKKDCRARYYRAKNRYQGQGIGWECMKQAFAEEKRFWDHAIYIRKSRLREKLYGKGF